MRHKIMAFVGKWVELEIIMPSKISLTQKVKNCIFSLVYGIQGKESENGMGVFRKKKRIRERDERG
jgi:hypothetical protein